MRLLPRAAGLAVLFLAAALPTSTQNDAPAALRGVSSYSIHMSGDCEKVKNAIIRGIRNKAPELRHISGGGVVLALHYVPLEDAFGKNAKDPPVEPLGKSANCAEARRARPSYVLRGYAVTGGRVVWKFEPKTPASTGKDFGDEFAKAWRKANGKD